MTAKARLFTHSGLVNLRAVGGLDYNTAGVQAFKQRYLGSDLLSCETGTPDLSDAAAAPTGTTCALLQVQAGKRVHYEISQGNGDTYTATTSSPIAEGNVTLEFGPGWQVSVLECSE